MQLISDIGYLSFQGLFKTLTTKNNLYNFIIV